MCFAVFDILLDRGRLLMGWSKIASIFSSLSDRFPGYNICGRTVPVNHIDVRGHGLLLPPYIDFYHINHLPWASFITQPPSCPNPGAGLANLYEINRTGMKYGTQNTQCVLLPPYGVGDLGQYYPDSKVHGAYMGPTCGRQDPGWPHVGPMILAIWVVLSWACYRRATI